MIIKRRTGAFDPTTFRDRYQDALCESPYRFRVGFYARRSGRANLAAPRHTATGLLPFPKEWSGHTY